MPRNLVAIMLVLVGACRFKASYDEGEFACEEGRCPSSLQCHEGRCVTELPDAPPSDAPGDMMMIDAREAALTCADPGTIPAVGGWVEGNTLGEFSRISATCSGGVMNGADDVYRIDLAAGAQLRVEIDQQGREAYVLTTCSANPGMCVENKHATGGNPIVVTVGPGPIYVIVDTTFAVPGGPYVLTVTVL